MGPSAGGRPVTGPNAVAWEIGARLRLVLESTGPPPGHRHHRPTDLAGVHLSSALLFGELARSDPTYATAAHESLQRAAVACASGLPAHRLFEGLVPVALVARLLATGPADYDEALAQLDARIVAATVDAVGEARASGDWPVGFSDHDQIQGLAGLRWTTWPGSWPTALRHARMSKRLGSTATAATRPVRQGRKRSMTRDC